MLPETTTGEPSQALSVAVPGRVPLPEMPQSLGNVARHRLWRRTLLVNVNPLVGPHAENVSSRLEKLVLWLMVTFSGQVGNDRLEYVGYGFRIAVDVHEQVVPDEGVLQLPARVDVVCD